MSLRTSGSPYVLGKGDGFEMRRIDASAIPAEMIKREIFGDRADKQFVSEAMRSNTALARSEQLTVSVMEKTRRPQPTCAKVCVFFRNGSVPVNLGPEAVCWITDGKVGRSVPLVSHVMRVAITSREMLPLAALDHAYSHLVRILDAPVSISVTTATFKDCGPSHKPDTPRRRSPPTPTS